MPLSAQSAINMHLGIGGIITKLGIEKRRNVKHAFKFMTPMVWQPAGDDAQTGQ